MEPDTPVEAPARPETNEQWHAKFLREALQQRARKLRSIADEFDRLAEPTYPASSYSQLSERAIHELMWGLANMTMDRVINEAASADVARAKGE